MGIRHRLAQRAGIKTVARPASRSFRSGHRAGNLEPPPHRRLRAVQAHLDPVHGSDGILRQFRQFLPRDALAANERLLLEASLYLLLQRLDRVSC
jgi:hypothetical protein